MIDVKKTRTNEILKILETVTDPEIPVLSVIDLGIVRRVELYDKERRDSEEPLPAVRVFITPTYSGCPAMDVIAIDIRMTLLKNGFDNVEIKTILSPAWTTDWMTEEGKKKLKAYGIAPPNIRQQVCNTALFQQEEAIQCPHCNSFSTHMVSRFGSTPCKALYQCNECKEPFDYFKCH